LLLDYIKNTLLSSVKLTLNIKEQHRQNALFTRVHQWSKKGCGQIPCLRSWLGDRNGIWTKNVKHLVTQGSLCKHEWMRNIKRNWQNQVHLEKPWIKWRIKCDSHCGVPENPLLHYKSTLLLLLLLHDV